MDNNALWIWKYGDYEIYHSLLLHMRRVEREIVYPTYWRMDAPSPVVTFCREYQGCGGYIKVHAKGDGYVRIDNSLLPLDTCHKIEAGNHFISICIAKTNGIPSIYVESDVIPSDKEWFCHDNNHKEKIPVGFDKYYDSPDKDPEIFPFEYKNILPVTAEEIDGGILYDFGKETFGHLNICGADSEKKLGIFYGESREEALDTDHTYTIEWVKGKSEYKLAQRAFRYIYIKNSVPHMTVTADFEYLPLKRQGSFRCDNETFNKIWDICAYTFHLNCREGFLDGIKRDRWIWGGDAYQCNRINSYLFFDSAIEQRTNICLIGKDPVDHHINGIVDYSFLYIIGLYEHYYVHGDIDFLKQIYGKAVQLMRFCETRINKDGFIEGDVDDWTFIDWSDIDKTGAVSAEQILCVKAYECLGKISEVVGEDGHEWSEKYAVMKQNIDKYFWDNEKGAYIDSYASGRRNVTRHANIFAIMFGIADKDRTESIINNVIKNDKITKITTPYFEGYELDVLAMLGEYSTIEKMFESYWGGMIRLGATTIWESYDPAQKGTEHYGMYGGRYDKSLCHAWGSTPVYIFGRYYLGVYPTSPAYDTFNVEPHLGGLGEIEGTVPVNGGDVKIKMNKNILEVTATKDGGTLLLSGKKYALPKDNTVTIELVTQEAPENA